MKSGRSQNENAGSIGFLELKFTAPQQPAPAFSGQAAVSIAARHSELTSKRRAEMVSNTRSGVIVRRI
jgi:hypothetical protein